MKAMSTEHRAQGAWVCLPACRSHSPSALVVGCLALMVMVVWGCVCVCVCVCWWMLLCVVCLVCVVVVGCVVQCFVCVHTRACVCRAMFDADRGLNKNSPA